MMKNNETTQRNLSRRTMLKTSAAAALPLLARSTAVAKPPEHDYPPITVGMATTGFQDLTNARMAREMKLAGIRTIQLFLTQKDSNYWKYNSRSDLAGLTPERCKAIADTYREQGIAIHSMGVYTNLLHPDPTEQRANLAYFDAMMKVGKHMGVHRFVTEAGHYHPEGPAPRVPYDLQEDVWRRAVDMVKRLAKIADANTATVLLEPSHISLFSTAKRTRLFLEEVDSPRVRALLDPANLLELNDLEEMFDQLEPWIDCFHAKDRKLHVVRGVAAGLGDLDYPEFVKLAVTRRPGIPLILEYVGTETYKQALQHLKGVLRQTDIPRR